MRVTLELWPPPIRLLATLAKVKGRYVSMPVATKIRDSFGAVQAKRAELTAHLKAVSEWDASGFEKFSVLEKEAADLHAEHKKWEVVADAERRLAEPAGQHPMGGDGGQLSHRPRKSIGEAFVESAGWVKFVAERKFGGIDCNVDLSEYSLRELKEGYPIGGMETKTAFTTAAGFAPFVQRSGAIVPRTQRQRPRMLPCRNLRLSIRNARSISKISVQLCRCPSGCLMMLPTSSASST